ncbi:hypothetical protein KPB2_5563 [Klebsiella pneumoniae Kb677]|nr:hypothetical protein KPB2_5563 [Klebsiella pneumoniae Kb677]
MSLTTLRQIPNTDIFSLGDSRQAPTRLTVVAMGARCLPLGRPVADRRQPIPKGT